MRSALAPILFGRPGWVPYGATLALDFTKGRGWTPNAVRPAAGMLTTTRSSSGDYADNNAGFWQAFSANQPRITDKGLLVEESRTNVVLYDRDLTNAAWTPTNITAAKDQTGVDNVANSASSITATAGNGTILQSITLASSARFQTAFVKRITGSGTVEMTMDNGATWTAVTVTAAWTRVSIPTQTLANPTVGFRIVTSGDAIAVDFVQNENGTFATSPIATTSASATRAADVVLVSPLPAFGAAYTLFAEGTPNAPTTYGTNQFLFTTDDASANNRVFLFRTLTSGTAGGNIVAGGATQLAVSSGGAWAQSTTEKIAVGLVAGSQAVYFDGTLLGSEGTGTMPATPTVMRLGSNSGGASFWNGYIRRIAYKPVRDASLQSMTA